MTKCSLLAYGSNQDVSTVSVMIDGRLSNMSETLASPLKREWGVVRMGSSSA